MRDLRVGHLFWRWWPYIRCSGGRIDVGDVGELSRTRSFSWNFYTAGVRLSWSDEIGCMDDGVAVVCVVSGRRLLSELEAEITDLAGHLNAAEYRFLMLVGEFDERKGWADAGCYSCAHWLNFKCGISLLAARERVRVAHALDRLPRISEAMRLGQISYSKVRALTRVACPQTEETLLMIALHGTANHVEIAVRAFRRAKEAEELSREARQQARKCVSYFYDDDGSLVLKARLPAEVGAVVVKALEAAVELVPRPEDHAAAGASSRAAWRADALGVVAEGFLASGGASLSGGERQQIVVHVDAETLRDSTAGRCELEHGPAIAAETARRLACDCSVMAIVENQNGEPLNVGRKTRTISPALRRALMARDKTCVWPGCTRSHGLHGHHLIPWAHGGETSLANLRPLCHFHHRLVHEGGFSIQVLDDGALRFLRPDGREVTKVQAQSGDLEQLTAQNKWGGIAIDRNTAVSRWCGERMDTGLAVDALLGQARRGQSVGFGWHDLEE